MKVKAAELDGDALDMLAQYAERGELPLVTVAEWAAENDYGWNPSRNWEQGGPIIERERIGITHGAALRPDFVEWHAIRFDSEDSELSFRGATALVAAMRCFVAHRFGAEVEIP